MSMEELGVLVTLTKCPMLPTLFPVGSTFLDSLREAGLALVSNFHFLQRQITSLLQIIK